MENYYIIDVNPRGEESYDFLVCSNENLTKEQVIERCKDKRLFYENRDARFADVELNPRNSDIAKYKGYTII